MSISIKKKDIVIALDISMRCTGIVCLDTQNNIMDMALITSKKEDLNDEALLKYNAERTIEFIKNTMKNFNITAIGFEGLSFNAKTGSKDILQGNFWVIRYEIFKNFPGIKTTVIAPKTWQKYVYTEKKEERKKIRKVFFDEYKDMWLKELCFSRLPKKSKEQIKKMIKIFKEQNELTKKQKRSKRKIKRDKKHFDLADAFFVGKCVNM